MALGLLLGVSLAVLPPAAAAWNASGAGRHAFAKYGTWSDACPDGGATYTATADGEVYGDNSTKSTQMTGGTMAVNADATVSNRVRSFVKFAPVIPNGCAVVSATFKLWNSAASVGSTNIPTTVVSQVGATWSEASKPLYGQLVVAGTDVTMARCSVPCERTANVTSIVTSWATGASNFGFRVTMSPDTTDNKTDTFASRETTTVPLHPPVLVVTWS